MREGFGRLLVLVLTCLNRAGGLQRPVPRPLLNVVAQDGRGAKRRGTVLALGRLFIVVGNQVAHDPTPVGGDVGAETAPEQDVFGDLQKEAGRSQRRVSITMHCC